MKYGIISDLHLNHYIKSNQDIIKNKIHDSSIDHLLIAGDLCDGSKHVSWLENILVPYTLVNGNHDYWNRYLESDKGVDGNVTYATLWTNFRNNSNFANHSFNYINDFNTIKHKNSNNYIVPYDLSILFNEHWNFIKQNQNDIIMTHFPPSIHSTHYTYKGNFLNPYFINDIDDEVIKNMDIKFWIHGHVHNHFKYFIGNICILANPLGYPGEIYESVDDYKIENIII